MKRGQQKCIQTPGTQQRMHLFGAYRWEEDTLVWKIAPRRNSQAFIEFLEHLFVECYPTGHFILVLDNASFHKSAASLAALSLFEHRVTVIWLPIIGINPYIMPLCQPSGYLIRPNTNRV